MSNNISTMYTKDKNHKTGRKSYDMRKHEKEKSIKPSDYLESQSVEDVSISFNQDINSYVIDVSYRRTDREGNQDMKLVEFILQPKK